jgi:hypothetical protein
LFSLVGSLLAFARFFAFAPFLRFLAFLSSCWLLALASLGLLYTLTSCSCSLFASALAVIAFAWSSTSASGRIPGYIFAVAPLGRASASCLLGRLLAVASLAQASFPGLALTSLRRTSASASGHPMWFFALAHSFASTVASQ